VKSRWVAIVALLILVVGFVVYAVGSDTVDATNTAGERFGLALVGLGLAGMAVAVGIALYRRATPVRYLAFVSFGVGVLFALGTIGAFTGSSTVEEAGDTGPSIPPVAMSQIPSPSPASTPAATASTAPVTAPPTSATAAAGNVAELVDATSDLLDENDEPVAAGPAHADIVRVFVEAKDGQVDLNIYSAEAPPTVDPVSNEIAYGWLLETTGDEDPDWQVLIQNTGEQAGSGWAAGITSTADGQSREGPEFPGSGNVADTWVNVRMPLEAIGNPAVIKAAALTQDVVWPDFQNDPLNNVLRKDLAPDDQWPSGSTWMTVRP